MAPQCAQRLPLQLGLTYAPFLSPSPMDSPFPAPSSGSIGPLACRFCCLNISNTLLLLTTHHAQALPHPNSVPSLPLPGSISFLACMFVPFVLSPHSPTQHYSGNLSKTHFSMVLALIEAFHGSYSKSRLPNTEPFHDMALPSPVPSLASVSLLPDRCPVPATPSPQVSTLHPLPSPQACSSSSSPRVSALWVHWTIQTLTRKPVSRRPCS